MLHTLENLIKLTRDRKSSPIEGSYTNKLLADKSLSKAKVLEEIDELIESVDHLPMLDLVHLFLSTD